VQTKLLYENIRQLLEGLRAIFWHNLKYFLRVLIQETPNFQGKFETELLVELEHIRYWTHIG